MYVLSACLKDATMIMLSLIFELFISNVSISILIKM